jgi:predicted NBD/HSP70 family sugar kinase/mannose-6-phosphate isomerase class I
MSEHRYKKIILGADVGGSHICAALVDLASGGLLPDSVRSSPVTADSRPEGIIRQWADTLRAALGSMGGSMSSSLSGCRLQGIVLAIPGPFDYREGISLMNGVNKYSALYGLNVKEALRAALDLPADLPIRFENDAACFGLGESLYDDRRIFGKIIAVTLGTGFGSTFLENQTLRKEGIGVAPNGELYNIPYLQGRCEDYVSGKWVLATYNEGAAVSADSVYTIAQRAISEKEDAATQVFHAFGEHLAACLGPWIGSFGADCVVIGGSIAKSAALFLPAFNAALQRQKISVPIQISEFMELSAIKGAAALINEKEAEPFRRKTLQPLLPLSATRPTAPGQYDMYPSFSIGDQRIFSGYDLLGEWLATRQDIMIEGFPGVDWDAIRSGLADYFQREGIRVCWYEMTAFQQPPAVIEALVQPFIGEPGDVWGKRAALSLADFFDSRRLGELKGSTDGAINIIIGTGAAFANWKTLVYIDMPKNEIQYRMRAGRKVSLTETTGLSNAEIYKRLYFVDWVVNKNHRISLYDRINVVADGQWGTDITWAFAKTVYHSLENMTRGVIRARPWFEAGAWGGQWLKHHIEGLNKEEVNYAWSFELIVPENGLVLESGGLHLEVAFDWLMERQAAAILGEDEKDFGTEFPIRFDYLDTMDGGNLSIQCHPSRAYIAREFGENFTQDETYYILDCAEDASVYLGFQEDVDPVRFRQELEASADHKIPLKITDYVQQHPAKKHDLFLIPNQTVHSAGKNNLVLEISATPYIFTFKMYDWLRLDLEGNPRPINIEHAFKNLDFSRNGKRVTEELISKPVVLEESAGYRLIHLPTHEEHFYAIHRIEFTGSVRSDTAGKCLVMMLVEGVSMLVKIRGKEVRLNYAETFIIPASVGSFELINVGKEEAKVIKAFLK